MSEAVSLFSQQTVPIRSVSLSIEDLSQLAGLLQHRLDEAAEMEISAYVRPPNMSDKDHQTLMADVRYSYRLTFLITGRNGETKVSHDSAVFSSPTLPNHIQSIRMESRSVFMFRFNNSEPRHWVDLFLDFTKPPLMDWSNPVSAPTPNVSALTIKGQTDGWVAAVHQSVTERLASRSNNRTILHRAWMYDFGLWLVAAPLAFFACSRIEAVSFYPASSTLDVVRVAFFIYVFILTAISFRVAFGYTRFVWPSIELKRNEGREIFHRRFWFGVMTSLAAAFIWAGLASF